MQPMQEQVPVPEGLELGLGAQFWVYLSPQNGTAKVLTSWTVQFRQEGGTWSGEIASTDPRRILQTPNLSGVFAVRVIAAGRHFPERELKPLSGSKPDVGCNSNCAAMVGIVADPGGMGARYWTTWDAICR